MDTLSIITAFLALPPEALPAADWIDSMGENGSAWPHLRDYVRKPERQRLNHLGEVVRLHADRPEWKDGVVVTLG